MSLPTSYRVRDLVIAPNVVLAPMEGVTDLPFRRLIRTIGGAGLTCTEFIASEGLKRGVGKMVEMAEFDPDERPIAVQIFGRRPEVMAEAARIVEDMGVNIVDINMGCPSKKVCAHSGGSALMKDPALAGSIVRAVRSAIQIPLTVKMRSGFSAEQRNAPEIAHICQEEGAEAVAIHWRTREDKYGGERTIDKIAETKQLLRIPVLANGDILDIESAVRMFEETGCDGIMVGRGAIRNPWLLLQISQVLAGQAPVEVTADERQRVLIQYLDSIRDRFRSERGVLGRFKKISNYFTKGLPHGSELRVLVLRSQSIEEAVEKLDAYFDRLRDYESGDREAFIEAPERTQDAGAEGTATTEIPIAT
jgi:nifR3 family TIM-barrel protein